MRKKGFVQVVPSGADVEYDNVNGNYLTLDFFSIVYTLCNPLSNSFKLLADQRANLVPVSLDFVLTIFLKSEMDCYLKMYLCMYHSQSFLKRKIGELRFVFSVEK